MISEKKNGFTRKIAFTPGYHKVHEEPRKNFGVHGMGVIMVLVGKKGAVHFAFNTGMMLDKTYDWWEENGLNKAPRKMHMGYDVGYHSPKPLHEWDEPTRQKKLKKTGKGPLDFKFENATKDVPVCEWIGVPCYCDGSAMRAAEWEQVVIGEGDEKIWSMLEKEYKSVFGPWPSRSRR